MINYLYYEKLIILKGNTLGRKKKETETSTDEVNIDEVNIDEVNIDEVSIDEKENKRTYKINKKLIRERVSAWFNTKIFKKFGAFWTITFPINIPEEERYRMLNIFFTRIRKNHPEFKNYIWVAERHKNNTIHFHIIVDTFINVQILNGYLKASIINYQEKNNLPKTENYNGFDLKKIKGNTRKVSMYLTKYVTKNKAEFNRLSWYCSKTLSNIGVRLQISEEQLNNVTNYLRLNDEKTFKIEEEYFTYYAVPPELTAILLQELEEYNNTLLG